jgi:TolB-like protein/DNA-binding winged helix-turn-helix (wHTH) protein
MNLGTEAEEQAAGRLKLGGFELDLIAGELLGADGQPAALRKQALNVLLMLGRRSGQVVGKDELMAGVWPHVVVGEGSLAQAIADIRRVLGDADHRLVRNVARRGYRLVPDSAAPPRPESEPASAAAPAAVSSDPGAGAVARRLRDRRAVWGGALALALLMAVGAVWLADGRAPSRWQTPASAARAPLPEQVPALSIVVLPLALEGDARDSEWFADALHGDLIIEVSRLIGSWVIARDTAASYKGKTIDPRQVARELGVRHIVRGTLRHQDGGTQIRLGLALVDGESGVQRWADTFVIERARLQRALGDFAVQLERVLQAELYRATAARRETLSAEQASADDLGMRAFALWFRGVTRDNVTRGLALLERAVAQDPDSVRGWAGIAFMTVNALGNAWVTDRTAAVRRVADAVAHLERLDRDGHYTYQAKTIQLYLKRDVAAMLQMTQAWTERYRHPVAFGAHGAALLFNGRFDEAAQAQELALRLSPRDPFRAEWQYRLAMAHFGAGRYELAHEWGHTAAATNPGLPWPPVQAAALVRLGQLDAARAAMADHLSRHPRFDAAQLAARMPGHDPAIVEARDRLMSALNEAGLR